jgi:hypothetical protein
MRAFTDSWFLTADQHSKVAEPSFFNTLLRFFWLYSAVLFWAPLAVHGQTISTVREVEFRSRWSNYHVDQPQLEPSAEARRQSAGEEAKGGIGRALQSLFRTGPIVLRGSLTTGWEYSNERLFTTQPRKSSTSSFFTAPAIAASYDREVGALTVSFRYSAGYLRYLDQNYTPQGGGAGGLSQTAGLDLQHQGSRLTVRSSTSASSGPGYDIERDRQTKRTAVAETLSADYAVSEFTRAGANFNVAHETYSGAANGGDDSHDRWTSSLYSEYVLTGKTGLRIELGAGQESQSTASVTSLDRSYYQALLRINYRPTAKFTLTPALGFGVLDETGQVSKTGDGFRAVYSLGVDYAPTEKTAIRLYTGVEGTAARPEFALAVNWHPRENTLVNLSIYQQSGLSTLAFTQDQTRRGVLLAVRQRFLQRFEAGLSGGWEEEVGTGGSEQRGLNLEPYYFFAATFAFEMNRWWIWQLQSQTSSRRNSSSDQGDGAQTRASIGFRLTF